MKNIKNLIFNKAKLSSKTTDILSSYIGNSSYNSNFSSNTLPFKFSSPSYFQNKFSYREKKICNNIKLVNKEFNDETLFLEQTMKFPSKIHSLNNVMRQSRLTQIKQLLFPKIKSNLSAISSQSSPGLIRMTFSTPRIQNQIYIIAEEVSRNEFTSPMLHELKSNFVIKKLVDENEKINKKLHVFAINHKSFEEIEESYDDFKSENIDIMKIKKLVINFLSAKDNKLNQDLFQCYEFFDKFENKVNFVYDAFYIPTIKNKFINYGEKMKKLNQNKNIISRGINKYLNKLRYHIQYNKDIQNKKETRGKESDKKSSFKLRTIGIKVSDIHREKYVIENYFMHKYTKYGGIGICEDKQIRSTILNI
jgi:hypothetical protein